MTTGLINIYNMSSSNREMELEVIEGVGSYGRQLGWLLEAVDVLIHKLEKSPSLKDLTHEEENALEQVKALKHRIDSLRAHASDEAVGSGWGSSQQACSRWSS